MDQFAEQLVKKNSTSSDEFKKVGIIAATVLLTAVSLYLAFTSIPIAVVLPVGIVYLGVYLFKLSHVEYEYSCTNGELDIDKIMGQTRRVNMLSVEVRNFLVFGRADDCELPDGITAFSATGTSLMDTDEEPVTYYAEFEHPEHGRCALFFTPDERMREAIIPFLPRRLREI